MEHTKSSFHFTDKRGEWQLDYTYIKTKSTYSDHEYTSLIATVYLNNDLYHKFDRLPSTKTDNPTKTQAKEIIAAAKKLNKESDKRDAKLNKLLN